MAALTTAEEYAAVRLAIQTLTTTGSLPASFTLGDMAVNYTVAQQIAILEKREETLAARLTQRNVRKRTRPDFTD